MNSKLMRSVILLAALAAGCKNQEQAVPPPEILRFEVAPEQVASGGEATFSWATRNATSVAVSAGQAELFKAEGAEAENGSRAVTLSTGGVFTLTAFSADGQVATRDVSVTVLKPARVIAFTATPPAVKAGGQTTLAWQTEDATELTVRVGDKVVFTESDPAAVAEGQRAVTVDAAIRFTLEARGPEGAGQAEVAVELLTPASITKFELAAASILEGESTTLSWETAGATSIGITADSGNGPVTLLLAGKDPARDSLTVEPTLTTTYTLSANAEAGSATRTATLEVRAKPVIEQFSAAPNPISRGQKTTLTWKTRNATSVALRDVTTPIDLTGKATTDTLEVSPTSSGPHLYTLTATEAGGSATSQVAVLTVLDPVPQILTFTANKAQAAVGETVRLSWTTSEATGVALEDNGVAVDLGTRGPNGSIDLVPTAGTHSYVLGAAGPGGAIRSNAVQVVIHPLPQIALFSADKASLPSGQKVRLTWTTQNATSVTLKDGAVAVDLGARTPNDQIELTPAEGSHDYVLTATGPGGSVSSSAVQVVVQPLTKITSFTANKTTLSAGETVRLSWVTEHATTVSLLDGSDPVSLGTLGVSGNADLTPTAGAHHYVLTATGPGGSVTSSPVEVTVNPLPEIASFEADKSHLPAGQTLTLTWTTRNATSISLKDGTTAIDVTGKTVNDNVVLTPAAGSHSYVLTAIGPGGSVSSHAAQVTVDAPPEIVSFVADRVNVPLGESVRFTWQTRNATSVSLKDGTVEIDLSGKKPSDTTQVTAALGAHSFVLTATGPGGTASATVIAVTVHPLPVVSTFSADKSSLPVGQTVKLTWTTQNVTSVALKDGGQPVSLGTKGPNDNIDLTPAVGVHSYVLTGTGPGGSVSSTPVTVTVHPLPQIITFTADKASLLVGQTVRLSWTTQDVTSVTLKDGSNSITLTGKTANDSIDLTPAAGDRSYVLTATGPGGSISSSPVAVKVHPLPVISSFSADKNTLPFGQPVKLSWVTQNATSVALKDGGQDVNLGAKGPSDNIDLSPSVGAHSYVLTATGPGGTVSSTAVSVTVNPLPQIVSFTATPTSVPFGQKVRLTWTTQDVTLVTLKDGATSVSLAGKGVNDFIDLSPAVGSHSYVLTATGVGGSTSSSPVAVTVHPLPAISSFDADKTSLPAGQTLTLSWATQNADQVSVMDGSTPVDLGANPPATGSVTLSPAQGVHSYVLTASGPGGSISSSPVAVTVHAPPAITSFVADKARLPAGQPLRLTWTTEGATSVSLKDGGTTIDLAGKAPNDFVDLAPAAGTHVYVLTASGPGGSVSSTPVQVVADPKPEIVSFVSSKPLAVRGETVRLSWTTRYATSVSLVDGAQPIALGEDLPAQIDLAPAVGTHAYVLTATGPGGTVSASLQVVVKEPDPIVDSFVADHTVLTEGQGVQLTWSVRHATSVTLFDDVADLGTFGAADSVTLAPGLGTHRFVIAASGLGGTTSSQPIVVIVGNQPPRIASFAADRETLYRGETLRLTWRTENVTAVFLKDGAADIDLSGKQVNDTLALTPDTGEHAYVLTVEGPGGLTESEPLLVSVVEPPLPVIASFEADRAGLASGERVILSWTTQHASSVSLEDDGAPVDVSGKTANDQVTLSPAIGTHSYRLTATGLGGSVLSAPVQVVVYPPPQILSFTADKALLVAGQTVRLSWTTEEAASVSMLDGATEVDLGDADVNGHVDLTPDVGTHSFVLTATGPGGVVSSVEVQVRVKDPQPVISHFAADHAEIAANAEVVLSWTTQHATAISLTESGIPVDLTGKSPTSDSLSVPLAAGEHTFVLTATGPGGRVESAPLQVAAFDAPLILAFATTRTSLRNGETLQLSWDTVDARSLQLTDSGATISLAGKAMTDVIDLRPGTGTHHYLLTATGPGGITPSSVIDVVVDAAPPVFTAFDLTPAAVSNGAQATLSWTATDTTDVYALPYVPGITKTATTYMTTTTGGAFEDISTTGTVVPGLTADDATATWSFPDGFAFPYLGIAANKAVISTNGWIGFADTYTTTYLTSAHFPDVALPNAIVAVFWNDLDPKTNGKIYAQLLGNAPDRRVIIQWNNYSYTGTTGNATLTFQAVLFESGAIELRYSTLTGGPATYLNGLLASVGFEDAGGNWGHEVCYRTANCVTGGQSLRFRQRLGAGTGSVAVKPASNGSYPFALTAVGPVGTAVTQAKTLSVVAVPTASTFSADRTSLGAGDPVKISWTTTNATRWRLDFNGVDVPNFPQQASNPTGGWEYRPTASGTLTLHAINAAGSEATKTVTLTVGPPTIATFKVDKTGLIQVGDTVTLSWTTTNCQSLTIALDTGDSLASYADPTDRTKMASGSITHTAVAGGRTYTLTATNGSGTVTRTASVDATADVTILALDSNLATVTAGEPLKLSWNILNATGATIAIADADPQPTGFPYAVPAAALRPGSLDTKALAADTTYELTATGASGTATRRVTVHVVPRPSFASFAADPPAGASLDPITLSWEAHDATKVTIKAGTKVIATDRPISGSLVVHPIEPTTYTAEATNQFGVTTVSAPLAVATTVQPATLTASATYPKIVRGNSTTISWAANYVDNLTVTPYLVERKSLGFVDISATGTKITFSSANDGYAKVTLPTDFTATFFGKPYSSMTVSTDGWFSFETYTSSYYTAKDFPTTVAPKTIIAPFWDDLNTGGAADSGVFWQVVGTAPNRKLIVQWNKWTLSASSLPIMTFEGILHENGDVELQYFTMDANGYTTPTRVTGGSAAIGLQNDEFGAAAKYFKHSYSLAGAVTAGDGMLVHLTMPLSGSVPVSPLTSTTYTFSASNSARSVTVPVPVEVFAPGDITLNELMILPGASGLRQWIELRNNTAKAIDLRGLTIGAGNGSHTITAASAVNLPANGYGLLAQSADPAENGGLSNVLYAYRGDPLQPNAAFSMDPALDVVALKAGTGTIDAVAYDAAAGWPLQAGRSMQADLTVKSAMVNDQPSVWCAGSGTPGAANPACYSWATVTGAFTTLAGDPGTTTLFTATASSKNDIALPFTFPYFGRGYPKINISSNGLVGFGTNFPDSQSTNYALPEATNARPDIIAPYWVSMLAATGKTQAVYTATRGAEPNRVFVVEWSGYYPTGGTASSDLAPVQLLLGEDGSIEFQYGALAGSKSLGQAQTIGLQAFGGGFASQFAFKSPSAVLTANSGLRLKRN